ncbi:hypothetical protein HPB51_022172 [Rhipicephalus microplus]|uniref:THAP-type domain-containing protein n=1 Tax=Rhipicephalus microplus TaxID=6941 RepID=A0A9J6E421_RHIMP|nr:hypothetical protein HPB51_022172 [Rhipicephalus microplus]
MCCVPQCTNRAVKDEISLHSFPLDVRLKKEWVERVRMGKPVTPPMKIPNCGHLIEDDLKKTAVPSRSMPIRTHEKEDLARIQEAAARDARASARHEHGSASQGTCWEPAQPVHVSPYEENPDGALCDTVGAFCTSGAAPGSAIDKLVLHCIVLLSNAGVVVDAVTCDNSTSNRSALNSLGVSGDIARVSTSFEHPWDSSEVIQVIIDPPHIFKCIRNSLLKAGKFLLPGDKEVQHFHFEALLDYEEQQAGLRAVPKLTKAHIRPNDFQKLSVKLAVQASLL